MGDVAGTIGRAMRSMLRSGLFVGKPKRGDKVASVGIEPSLAAERRIALKKRDANAKPQGRLVDWTGNAERPARGRVQNVADAPGFRARGAYEKRR